MSDETPPTTNKPKKPLTEALMKRLVTIIEKSEGTLTRSSLSRDIKKNTSEVYEWIWGGRNSPSSEHTLMLVAWADKHEANDKAITVWRWKDAPEKYKKLSEHGGDEDWVAYISEEFIRQDFYIPWMNSGTSFRCCDVSEHAVGNGIVRIGAHA